jgi:hypothetical protein
MDMNISGLAAKPALWKWYQEQVFEGKPDQCGTKDRYEEVFPPGNPFEVPDDEEDAQTTEHSKMKDAKQKIKNEDGSEDHQKMPGLQGSEKTLDCIGTQLDSVAAFCHTSSEQDQSAQQQKRAKNNRREPRAYA